jgi:serine/threonine-protein kinase
MYMSPEQCAGAGKVDDRTDVYALGCVLFQMLAGRPPFYAEGAGELIGMHLFQPPPSLLEICPTLPKPIAAIVARMLTKEKSQRPNMALIAEELRQLLSVQTGQSVLSPAILRTTGEDSTQGSAAAPITTFGQSAGQNTADQRRKNRTFFIGGGCAGLLLCVMFWVRLKQPSTASAVINGVPPVVQTAQHTAVSHAAQDRTDQASKQSPSVPQIRWQIDSLPSHAKVLDESGKTVGETPWILEQESAAGSATFYIKHDGFQDQRILLSRGESKQVELSLRPLVAVDPGEKKPKLQARSKPVAKTKPPTASALPKHEPLPEIRYEE